MKTKKKKTMDKDATKDIQDKVKGIISEILGIDKDDIQDEDSLTEDLRMKPTEISDFAAKLTELGFDTSELNFDEADTVYDLSEALSSRSDI